MPRFRVDITYDMGMSSGVETHEFGSLDDNAAIKYIENNEGKSLGSNKRGVHFKKETLSRVILSSSDSQEGA